VETRYASFGINHYVLKICTPPSIVQSSHELTPAIRLFPKV
jgi:hypothetical protein